MSKTLTDKKRTLIFVNIIITCVASSLLSTALTTALPPIIFDLNISVTTGQWLTSAYSLVMAIMMPLTAYLITRIPTRRLYIVTIAIFLVGTGICMIAPNFQILMLGRLLQACSNGISTSIAQVILLSIYPIEKRGSIMGWYGLCIGAAPVVAPTLAGILVDIFSWRMIFVLAFVVMLVSFIYAVLVLEDVLETTVKKFDMISFLFSAFAFGGITLGIGNISKGIFVPETYMPLIIGIIGGGMFIYRQLHITQPFLELRTFENFNFTLSVLNSMMLYLVMMGSSILMPLYVQNMLGYSATISGLVMLPGSLVMSFISPLAGKIYDKVGMRILAIVGSIAIFVSISGMCFISAETPLAIAAFLNAIRCVAIGCLMMPFVTWGISHIAEKNTADGTALINSLRTIAGAIGTAVFVGIMNFVATKSSSSNEVNASIQGMHVSFAVMSLIAGIMVLVAIFCVKSISSKKSSSSKN